MKSRFFLFLYRTNIKASKQRSSQPIRSPPRARSQNSRSISTLHFNCRAESDHRKRISVMCICSSFFNRKIFSKRLTKLVFWAFSGLCSLCLLDDLLSAPAHYCSDLLIRKGFKRAKIRDRRVQNKMPRYMHTLYFRGEISLFDDVL